MKTLAKAALQNYIASFLDTTGVNRTLITATSPAGVNFVTDQSLLDSKDGTYKPTQLARMYNEIRQKSPSILIIDSSFEWVPTGLNGGLERASNVNGKWQGYFRMMARVGTTVAIVANDQDTVDVLQNVLMMMFDPFRNITGGSRLRSSKTEDSWEVRLPLTFEASANTPDNFEGDSKEQYWHATIELQLDVEDCVSFEMDLDQYDIGVGNVNDANFTAKVPIITSPSQVRIGAGRFRVSITGFNPRIHKLYVDNPDIASLELDGLLIQVTPRRTGTFNLCIVDTTQRSGDPQAPFTHKVVASVPVAVTF